MPADEVPPEIPGPALGINFSRDGMRKKDWFSLVIKIGFPLLLCIVIVGWLLWLFTSELGLLALKGPSKRRYNVLDVPRLAVD